MIKSLSVKDECFETTHKIESTQKAKHQQANINMSKSDWRVKLLGDFILLNKKEMAKGDVEEAIDIKTTHPTKSKEAVDEIFKGYDYIALFFGANYCSFCKKFSPRVVASKPFFEAKKCKVIFVSNDRDEENFLESCFKVQGIDVMQYDTSKTSQMRDLFGLKTIPALMILKNADFEKSAPFVYSNAREILELDPQCENFPWGSIEKKQAAPVTAMERFWIHGRHGRWWQLGHRNVSDVHPSEMYMDEHAVRARAGLLNIITWLALMNVFFMRDQTLVKVIFGIVAWEFVTSMVFGLTPFAPLGWVGTGIAVLLQPAPLWKPASPKRFAWLIGLILATSCFVLVQFQTKLGESYIPAVAMIALACNMATWLEGNAGFCVGCVVYNNFFTKYFNFEECKECKL